MALGLALKLALDLALKLALDLALKLALELALDLASVKCTSSKLALFEVVRGKGANGKPFGGKPTLKMTDLKSDWPVMISTNRPDQNYHFLRSHAETEPMVNPTGVNRP